LDKVYHIRRDVLNLTLSEWGLLGDGDYTGSVEKFLNEIGLPNGFSAKYNEEEREFFDEIYKLYRKKIKS